MANGVEERMTRLETSFETTLPHLRPSWAAG